MDRGQGGADDGVLGKDCSNSNGGLLGMALEMPEVSNLARYHSRGAKGMTATGDIFHNGFILLHRSILEKPYFKDAKTLQLVIYLLLRANHKNNMAFIRGQIVKVKRGQLIFGRKKASKETGLTEREIRTRLQFLRNVEFLTIRTTNRFSLITIRNYDHYQTLYKQNDHQNDQQTTSKRPRTIKPIKPIKDKYDHPQQNDLPSSQEKEDLFGKFWEAYPRKVAKKKAGEIFARILKKTPDSAALVEQMVAAIKVQREIPDWKKEGGKFIPYPTTWLNGERWLDETEVETETPMSITF